MSFENGYWTKKAADQAGIYVLRDDYSVIGLMTVFEYGGELYSADSTGGISSLVMELGPRRWRWSNPLPKMEKTET